MSNLSRHWNHGITASLGLEELIAACEQML